MNPILFEQIRDKVKEVGVAEMINDRLLELHTVENKKKMFAALDVIRTRQRTDYEYEKSPEIYIWNYLTWMKGRTTFIWYDTPDFNIELKSTYNNSMNIKIWWSTPKDIIKFKVAGLDLRYFSKK